MHRIFQSSSDLSRPIFIALDGISGLRKEDGDIYSFEKVLEVWESCSEKDGLLNTTQCK